MPTYEYRCLACQHEFVEIMTIGEHDAWKPKCPKCKGKKIEKVFSAVSVKTAKKS